MADMDMGHDHNGGEEHHHDHSAAVHMGLSIPITLVISLGLVYLSLGLILPYGFVCKRAHSPRHLPVQIVGGALAGIGAFFGHLTGIEHYNPWWVDLAVVYGLACVGLSLLLLIYVPRGVLFHAKNALDTLHTVLSVLQPLVCWVFAGLGFISLLQFCKADHLGQCLAHGIMGTAFVVYGAILIVMLYVGEGFLARRNRSQEYFDSWVITLWGIVNTFTEHRWGQDWNHGDIQHTSMGIIWWAAGMVGIYLSWDRAANVPRRTHLPGLIICITGYAMMTHAQNTMVSTNIHFMFGVMLMLAGLARIIEISFVLHDQPHRGRTIHTWQYLPAILLVESGMLFMSATEEAMKFLHDHGIMAAPYVLFISSIACLVFLVVNILLQSYASLSKQSAKPERDIELQPFVHEESETEFDVDDAPSPRH